MENLLKKLGVRASEKGVFFHFFSFNLILYAGVFLGRAIRDALFFSQVGAQYLPLVFIANAITMSVFGTYFARWTGKGYSLRKVSVWLFICAAAIILLFSFLFSLNLSGSIPGTEFPLGKLAIIVFYWLTEIPIFLMLNMIWIIADGYISESMAQRLTPKIIGGGHLGIVIGGIVAVLVPSLFSIRMQSLTYVWAGIVALEILMIGLIYKVCRPLPREVEEEIEEGEIEEKRTGFIQDFINSFQVVKKYRYSVYFALIALFNFFLFGINDYMLNSRAIEAGIGEEQLVTMLGYFTIGFGLFSALFQFTFFTRIIKKFGIARTNLGGGIVFVIGAVILLLTSTHMFEPVQHVLMQLFNIEKVWLLLYSIALVRFGGYIAEYLFNQTVIPSIYGAIPEEDREITRTFIEGTFVQMVFGMTGILLVLYKLVFGGNLDLLILLGALSASLMLTFSWLMVGEYKKMIELSKKSMKERIIARMVRFIPEQKVRDFLNRKNTFIVTALIEFLGKNNREEFVKDVYDQLGRSAEINRAVIDGIIELNNLEYFDKLLDYYIEFEPEAKRFFRFKRGDSRELRALLSGFYRMRHNYDVLDMFAGVEDNPRCTEGEKQEIIYFMSRLDNKNGIVKADHMLRQLKDKNLAMRLSAEIGFDHFSAELRREIGEMLTADDEVRDYDQLAELVEIAGKMSYARQETQFAVFRLILESLKFLEIRAPAAGVVRKMMQGNPFLVLLAVDHFLDSDNHMPVEELPLLLKDIPVIETKEMGYLQEMDTAFSGENIPTENGHFSINRLLTDFIENGKPGVVLNAYRVLHYRLENRLEEGRDGLEHAGRWAQRELKRLYLSWVLMAACRDDNRAAYRLAWRRADQYYKKALLYALKFLTEAEYFEVEHFYKRLVSGNRTLKDNTITVMEQCLPREYFKPVDEYFYLDDEETASRETDLAAKAKELYGEDASLDRALKILADEVLNQFMNTSEVKYENQ